MGTNIGTNILVSDLYIKDFLGFYIYQIV